MPMCAGMRPFYKDDDAPQPSKARRFVFRRTQFSSILRSKSQFPRSAASRCVIRYVLILLILGIIPIF